MESNPYESPLTPAGKPQKKRGSLLVGLLLVNSAVLLAYYCVANLLVAWVYWGPNAIDEPALPRRYASYDAEFTTHFSVLPMILGAVFFMVAASVVYLAVVLGGRYANANQKMD